VNLIIDLSSIYNFFSLPVDEMIRRLIYYYGWIPVAYMFVWGAIQVWLYYRQILFKKTIKFVLLAIDIPRNNELSPKGVENLFSYLGGGHEPPDLIEKWWQGMFQLAWCFEIVSIDGYIQFLVYTPTKLRELLETAIYSQYPDAEINEVNDYTEGVPTQYPNEEYNVWGSEFIQAKNEIYPIKTYKEFEHQASAPETQFKDPMAVLMDMMSSMKKGEQFWYQIIVYPTGFDWVKKGDKEISKILKEKSSTKKGIGDAIIDGAVNLLWGFSEMIFATGVEEEKKKDDDALKMMNLKPKEKKQVESIQEKISKQGFECKIRFAYVAKKEVFNKAKAIFGIIGFMKQFMDLDLNNLKPDMDITATSAHYFFVDSRKNEKKKKLISAYKDRTGTRGRRRFILNIEELATLWHFPIEAVVKAPLIQKSPGRKAEPPMSLPVMEETSGGSFVYNQQEATIDNIFLESENKNKISEKQSISEKFSKINNNQDTTDNIFKEELNDMDLKNMIVEKKGQPPENLPFV
jgi:hypothetical protein